MYIREATAHDDANIVAIQKQDGYPHAYYLTNKRIRDLRERKEVFLVVEDEGEIVAFACVVYDVRAKIHFFSVRQTHQRKHIGSVLLEHIINESKKRQLLLLYVIVEKDASILQSFLENHRFVKAGYHMDRFGKGKDGIMWNLSL